MPKIRLKDIKSFPIEDISKMNKSDLFKFVKSAQTFASGNITRLENSGIEVDTEGNILRDMYYVSPAVRTQERYLEKKAFKVEKVDNTTVRKLKKGFQRDLIWDLSDENNVSLNALRFHAVSLIRFLNAKTSTPAGIRKMYEAQDERITNYINQYIGATTRKGTPITLHLTTQQRDLLWEAYNEFKRNNDIADYGSDRLQSYIFSSIKNGTFTEEGFAEFLDDIKTSLPKRTPDFSQAANISRRIE